MLDIKKLAVMSVVVALLYTFYFTLQKTESGPSAEAAKEKEMNSTVTTKEQVKSQLEDIKAQIDTTDQQRVEGLQKPDQN